MKVLFIGCYRDGTGYGHAAADYILALDAAGVDVACRPLKLNNHDYQPNQRILELENKVCRGPDIVIQHTLPHLMEYCGKIPTNLALFASETSHFRGSSWAAALNNMDGVIVINEQMAGACRKSGVEGPILRVPHATDISRFEKSYEPLPELQPLKTDGGFVFYTIGEMHRRKNLAALLKAYYLEFNQEDNVSLVVKTWKDGSSNQELDKHIRAFNEQIIKGLKIHGSQEDRFPSVVFLLDRLTEEGMMRLHASCDVFVQPSYGEAWSIPAFDAMAMGKTPIVTDCTGYQEYVDNDNGWLVTTHREPCFGMTETFADLYKGDEEWWSVDVPALRRAMREAYRDASLREEKAVCGLERAYDFSHQAVGDGFKRVLEYYAQESKRPAGSPLADAPG
jgi:glycosyltransferase involved in cell wall biosynthesis